MERKWWHDKIGYQIYPKSFYDSNGDGVGDLRGVIEKLDYLRGLGVDILWLSPVYPSPMRDNGYDISDYYAIDPRFGTMEDMEELLAEAKKRGMYVLMDLVINHCSDQHEWFQRALADPEGEYGRYFYFRKGGEGGEPPNNWRSYFGGSVWEKVSGTDWYYLHLFDKGQPDLNWENEKLRKELYKMINWWLHKGIAGFRVDAIMNIKKDLSFQDYTPDGPDGLAAAERMVARARGIGDFLEELRRETFDRHDAFTIGEVFNMAPEDLPRFIGKDGYFDCQFDFDHVVLRYGGAGWYQYKKPSFREWRDTIFETQKRAEPVGFVSNIIENHDEPRGLSTFIPEEDICYESATALATASVLLRGLPFLYQGQEIGMTNCRMESIEDYDDVSTLFEYKLARQAGLSGEEAMEVVYRESRDNSRTMMQWTAGPNAGFTRGEPWFKVNPNYVDVNVEAQERAERSVLKYYRRLLALRKDERYGETLTYGSFRPILTEREEIMGYRRTGGENTLTVLCNFSREEIRIPFEATADTVCLNNYETLRADPERGSLTLKPYQAVVMAR